MTAWRMMVALILGCMATFGQFIVTLTANLQIQTLACMLSFLLVVVAMAFAQQDGFKRRS